MQKKILIVEDESVVALDIQMILEHLGYIVPEVVSRGEDVLGVVQKTNPDLVLMDIHLAGKMDGVEAANQLRLLNASLPIIFLTAFVDEAILQRASLTGSFGYILKPFEERELTVNIQMALYKAQFEQTLRNQEAYFRALIENSTDIISIIDTEGITRFVSPSVSKVLGYQPEELVGKNAFDLIHPQDQMRSIGEFQAGMNGLITKATEQFRYLHKNGEWCILEVHACIHMENSFIKGAILNTRDITERAEIAEALRVERDRAQKYLNTARVILLELNEHGEVTLINPYALEILGYREEEVLGKNWFDLCVPPEIRRESEAWLREMLHGAAKREYSREHSILNNKGEMHCVAWRSAPLTADGGRVTSVLFTGEDITARQTAEERVE